MLLVIVWLVHSILCFYLVCMAMYPLTALIHKSQLIRYPFLSSLHLWTAEQSALNSFMETHNKDLTLAGVAEKKTKAFFPLRTSQSAP